MKNLIFALIAGLVVFCMTGCSDESDGASGISTMTISNIPAAISGNDTYKLYLSASNDTDPNGKAVCQAVLILDTSTLPANTPELTYTKEDAGADKTKVTVTMGSRSYSYTVTKSGVSYKVTFPLRKPAVRGTDPNLDNGSWSGKANFFSLMLTPQTVTGTDSVYIKASMKSLNNDMAKLNWNGGLIDFQSSTNKGNSFYIDRKKALYDAIIVLDPHITKPAP